MLFSEPFPNPDQFHLYSTWGREDLPTPPVIEIPSKQTFEEQFRNYALTVEEEEVEDADEDDTLVLTLHSILLKDRLVKSLLTIGNSRNSVLVCGYNYARNVSFNRYLPLTPPSLQLLVFQLCSIVLVSFYFLIVFPIIMFPSLRAVDYLLYLCWFGTNERVFVSLFRQFRGCPSFPQGVF